MTEVDHDINLWEERADYIDDQHINEWTAETTEFKELNKVIISPGAKMIAGPRGSGKTHLMRYSYNQCIETKSNPFPVYASYGKYYSLEPFLTSKANAQKIFHTWVIIKLLLGLQHTIEKLTKSDLPSFWMEKQEISEMKEFAKNVEKGFYAEDEKSEAILRDLHIERLHSLLKKCMTHFKRKRCILLLDDAALTLTPEYLTEFFDVFRNLIARNISPKASVYPGSTDYGPRFHLGHDAKLFNVWKIHVDQNEDLLQHIAAKRFQSEILNVPNNILKLFMVASFGIPRTFINMINDYLNQKETHNPQQLFNKIIETHAEYLRIEYRSIKKKLTQYGSIIGVGEKLFDSVIKTLADANINLSDGETKQFYIGFEKQKGGNILEDRMIRFLTEAGLFYPAGDVSHGYDRKYERYIPHLLFLIQKRAFSAKSRGFNPDNILEFIDRKNEKHPERKKIHTILSPEDLKYIKLDLPLCSNCSHERISESQKFCHNCGAELVNESKYQECMKIPINELPILTKWRKERILEETDIKTIGDLLHHRAPASELRKGKGIGKIRSEDIYKKTLSYVKEFLS